MADADEIATSVAVASWPDRIAIIRRVPEQFGTAQHAAVYASIATAAYASHLTPDFGYVHWRDEYELASVEEPYQALHQATDGFARVDVGTLAAAIESTPSVIRVLRLIVGLTAAEFAAATQIIAAQNGTEAVGVGRVKGMEEGNSAKAPVARACAAVVDAAMAGALFPPASPKVRSKLAKPDTLNGWDSVRRYAQGGVPFQVYLHQRHYGGAFRQLLDATSTRRGDVLEDAVEELFLGAQVPFIRTSSDNQEEIAARFGLTLRPAPDFAVYDAAGTLKAILECKAANDGGTARDKAARFRSLRAEAARLGGIPVFAVLAGLGWRRAGDALGPVVRDTDGRVFTLATLSQILTIDPLPTLSGVAAATRER